MDSEYERSDSRYIRNAATEIVNWIERLCSEFSRFSPYECCDKIMKILQTHFVQKRLGCQALLDHLNDSYGDNELLRLRSLYDRPFSQYRSILTLVLALVHKMFDVNSAPLPPLHVAVLCPNSEHATTILLWVRPEIQDRQYHAMGAHEENINFTPLPRCSTALQYCLANGRINTALILLKSNACLHSLHTEFLSRRYFQGTETDFNSMVYSAQALLDSMVNAGDANAHTKIVVLMDAMQWAQAHRR
jgi:ankyrin repeat protein